MAANLGINFEIAPSLPIIDGIESVRRLLGSAWFDEENCKAGIRSLRNYRKEWDDKRQAYKTKPLHDWTSHCADAMRYCAVSAELWEQQPVQALQQTRMRLAAYVAGDSSIGY
jgi:phage terminase large subunit